MVTCYTKFRPRSGAERRGRRVKTDCWSFCVCP
nr:MAG TPA: hypothetical protein [Caudoviricetes sp.]